MFTISKKKILKIVFIFSIFFFFTLKSQSPELGWSYKRHLSVVCTFLVLMVFFNLKKNPKVVFIVLCFIHFIIAIAGLRQSCEKKPLSVHTFVLLVLSFIFSLKKYLNIYHSLPPPPLKKKTRGCSYFLLFQIGILLHLIEMQGGKKKNKVFFLFLMVSSIKKI